MTTALRAALVVLAAGALGLQVVLVVATVMSVSGGHPPFPAVFHTAAAVAALACVEAAFLAIWVLLSMVRRDAIFDERAFRWVPVIGVAGLLASVLVGALCAHLGELDDAPGLVLVGGGIGLAGIAFALLMTVMLGLLRSATRLRRELEQVV
jgi:hypothetical protein